MIAKKVSMKNIRLSSFSDLVSYLSTSQGINNRVDKIEMHNFNGLDNDIENLELAIYDVLRVQDTNKTAKSDKTYHLIVSFADGEDLSNEQLSVIEQSMIEALGYAEHQRISVVHRDTDNLHFHVAINKIHPTKFTYHEPYKDFKILGEQCRKFENELGLKKVERGQYKKNSIDMEEMSGLESMIGWIQRNLLDSIKNAQSWTELHKILSEHGLELKKRGNGFVIGNNEIYVKASSIDRDFSKFNLERRLGEFESSNSKTGNKNKEYQKKPYYKNNNIGNSELYARYLDSRDNTQKDRENEINNLKLARNKDIAAIRSKYKIQLALAKRSTGAKYLLIKLILHNQREEIKNRHKRFRFESDQVYKKNKQKTWADWLTKEAAAGNKEALQALRKRGKKAKYNGNQFTGKSTDDFTDINIDKVTKKGTIIYEQDNFTIRDTGESLKLGNMPDDRAVEKALEMAIKKYGGNLNISGTQYFQRQVARIAAEKGLNIQFENVAINQEFERYKKEYEYVRTKRRANTTVNGNGGSSKPTTKYRKWAGTIPNRYRFHKYERDGRIYGKLFGGENISIYNVRPAQSKRSINSSQTLSSVRSVSKRSMVFPNPKGTNQKGTKMLLSGDVSNNMVKSGARSNDSIMRWSSYWPRIIKILKNGQKIIQQHESIVGLVGKPGTKPPGFRRRNLKDVSSLKSVVSTQNSTKSSQQVTDRLDTQSIQNRSDNSLDSVQKYINERLNKKQKGFDIMNHRRYNATDSGTLVFKGTRKIDGDYLGLFQSNKLDEILVLPLTEYAQNRLTKLKLGTKVQVTKNGQVRIIKLKNQR